MMVKSHDLNFVPGSNLSRLASAFINVSWTRSSASGGLRQRVRANARRAGISFTRSARAGSRLNCDSDTVTDLSSLAGMTGTNAGPAVLVPPRYSLASATPSGADNHTRSTPIILKSQEQNAGWTVLPRQEQKIDGGLDHDCRKQAQAGRRHPQVGNHPLRPRAGRPGRT